MALAMEFMSGNTRIRIMDDYCSAPDQKERDAAIKERVYRNALRAIQNNPERYYALMKRKGIDLDGEEKETANRAEGAQCGKSIRL